MQSGKYESFLNPRGKKRKVQMQPLAPFLEHLEVGVNIAVKMDIEGMEYEVLESL